MSVAFDEKVHSTLADANLQLAIYRATARLIDHRKHAVTAAALPDYQELRTHANANVYLDKESASLLSSALETSA